MTISYTSMTSMQEKPYANVHFLSVLSEICYPGKLQLATESQMCAQPRQRSGHRQTEEYAGMNQAHRPGSYFHIPHKITAGSLKWCFACVNESSHIKQHRSFISSQMQCFSMASVHNIFSQESHRGGLGCDPKLTYLGVSSIQNNRFYF